MVFSGAAEMCRNRVLGCCFHGHVYRGKVDRTLRDVASSADSDGHTTFVTAQTGLKLPVYRHVLETVSVTRTAVHSRFVAVRLHSSVVFWSILTTGSLPLTCIPLPHQIMASKFRSLFMIYFLSVQFSVPYSIAAKRHIFFLAEITGAVM